MNRDTPGVTIRRARQEERLTQAQLATELGVHKNTVADWEKGKYFPDRHWAALNKLLRISLVPPGAPGPAAAPAPDVLADELGQDKADRVRKMMRRYAPEVADQLISEMERVLSSPGEEGQSGPARAVS